MLDNILGRPSAGWKRVEVILVLLTSYTLKTLFLTLIQTSRIYGLKSQYKPFKFITKLNSRLAQYKPWKVLFSGFTIIYFLNNLFLLLGLNAPEPLAKLYTRNFFRASWILTALDAGFLTAKNIRFNPLKQTASIIFFLFYLVNSDAADEKVRKFRNCATTETMRISWDKPNTPILRFLTFFNRGFLSIRQDLLIPRPSIPTSSSFSPYPTSPIKARLYYSGTKEQLLECNELILQIPGGGFISMSPRCHDDYVSHWARNTGIPIVSIDYGKSPEYPYPWALEECFDAYTSINDTHGSVVGLSGKKRLKITVIGDSAYTIYMIKCSSNTKSGGNLAVGVVMKAIESESDIPCGLLLIYPCLSFDLNCWMPNSHLNLMRAESFKSISNLINSKQHLNVVSPLNVQSAPRNINILNNEVDNSTSWYKKLFFYEDDQEKRNQIPTNLSMTSRMAYFTDRIISPEMMRAMALLYLGGSPLKYDMDEEYYLSPLCAPESVLEQFPKTFIITGEKDPLVDDSVVFASRLRKAKEKKLKSHERDLERHQHEQTDNKSLPKFKIDTHYRPLSSDNPSDHAEPVRVKIIEGISHGFFQMLAFLPEAAQATQLTSEWILELMDYVQRSRQDSDLNEVSEKKIMSRRRQELADTHLHGT